MVKKTTKKRTRKAVSKPQRSSGDVITIQNVGAGAAIAGGRQAKASVNSDGKMQSLANWATEVNRQIDALPNLSQNEKQDIRQQVEKIKEETQKGASAETGRLERLLNSLAAMAPDIFEVAIVTLANPLAGIGLVAKKIGDRAKVERAAAGA